MPEEPLDSWEMHLKRRENSVGSKRPSLLRRLLDSITGFRRKRDAAMALRPALVEDGIHGDLQAWLDFNRVGAFASRQNLALVAPFPPRRLMHKTTALRDTKDFAAHGHDILKALSRASPTPLSTFADVLDFGVGVGRLARMFKGFRGHYTGIDVDTGNIAWVAKALNYVDAIATKPRQALPFVNNRFDCIISISVFTHMSERDQFFYLAELARVARPGATLLLTVHGERVLQRAETETRIFEMLAVPRHSIVHTRNLLASAGFSFVLQPGGLNSEKYEYGTTFISADYIEREWSRYFDIERICPAAIHDFQDIVVLRAR